jgi:putative lipoprotein
VRASVRRRVPSSVRHLQAAALGIVAVALLVASMRPRTGPLPEHVEYLLRVTYEGHRDVRYVEAATDLSGDGRPEIVVHVMGPTACWPDGCDTHVFTPVGSDAYRQVGFVIVSSPPIRASSRKSRGWKNLVVRVSDDGAATHDAELEFNGTRYPDDPSLAASLALEPVGEETLIRDDVRFETAEVLIP